LHVIAADHSDSDRETLCCQLVFVIVGALVLPSTIGNVSHPVPADRMANGHILLGVCSVEKEDDVVMKAPILSKPHAPQIPDPVAKQCVTALVVQKASEAVASVLGVVLALRIRLEVQVKTDCE
jgi:hypothetical protein